MIPTREHRGQEQAAPFSGPPRILDESPDWIVLDKPPGLEAHPSKPGPATTLWHLLRDLLAYELVNGGQISIVNRLDRETSGITFVAKTKEAARRFALQMQRRRAEKTYLAIACGWPDDDRFEIDAPVARQGDHGPTPVWHRRAVHPDGLPSATRFGVLARFERPAPVEPRRFALLEARPLTGRMHQIRLHLAHAGHPIVGDKLYGPDPALYLEYAARGWSADLARALLLPRHALHAARLAFPDEGLAWQSPLPPDLAAWAGELNLHPAGER